MSANSFGHYLTCITWGESHGHAIGCVCDGVPANIAMDESDIQVFLDQRKPGQSNFVTQRRESDQVRILSGIFKGKTTGTPISLMIENQDTRSHDYSDIANQFRPGHGDLTYFAKYRNRDYRGGGRASARETAMRVVAGAIARKILSHVIKKTIIIEGAVIELGGEGVDARYGVDGDWSYCKQNELFCPDPEASKRWKEHLKQIRKEGDSLGAVIALRAKNVPMGLGQPIYRKLDSEIAKLMMSINAVKSVEIGTGIDSARLKGSQNNDQMHLDDNGQILFGSNHAGGILAGISSGQDIIVKLGIKPTSSILKMMHSIDQKANNIEMMTKGRHDPCVGIRAVPVGEAMLAFILADCVLGNLSQLCDLNQTLF
ncbi:MAG: chorismate synthase [Pseudomonadota bacterium]